MKFIVSKKAIDDVLDKLHEVATKGLKAEFKMSNRITLKAKKDCLVLLAANGNMDAQCDLTDGYEPDSEGIVTLDATKFRDIVKFVGELDDDKLEFEKIEKGDSTSFRLRDISTKRKTWAKMPILSQDHVFSVSIPRKSFKHTLPAATLSNAFNAVARYKSVLTYEPVYLVLCMHFLPEETRFVCGDGGLFAVLTTPNASTNTMVDEAGEQYVLPAEQSNIIARIIEEKESVTVYYKDTQACCFEADNIKIFVKGIPDVQYIAYQDHAYNVDDATAIVDFSREELQKALRFVGVLEDEDMQEEGLYHSCLFKIDVSNQIMLQVLDGKYQGETQMPVNFYPGTKDSFESVYAHDILSRVVAAGDGDVLRFYCLDPMGVVVTKMITHVDKDNPNGREIKVMEAGIEVPNTTEEPELVMFFTSAKENEED